MRARAVWRRDRASSALRARAASTPQALAYAAGEESMSYGQLEADVSEIEADVSEIERASAGP